MCKNTVDDTVPHILLVRIDRVKSGPTVEDCDWYMENNYSIFSLNSLEQFPEPNLSIEPYLEPTYVSYGEKCSNNFQIERVKICHRKLIDYRRQDLLLLKFLEHLFHTPILDGGFYHLSPQQLLALRNIAGMGLNLHDKDIVDTEDSALFLYVEWLGRNVVCS